MFGRVHIEMAAFETIGHLLDGSGWAGALVQANVAPPGTADSFHRVTRGAHPTSVPDHSKQLLSPSAKRLLSVLQ